MIKIAIETEVEYWKRHLRDYKQFEFEERMLRQKYEEAFKKIKAMCYRYTEKGWALNPDKIEKIIDEVIE